MQPNTDQWGQPVQPAAQQAPQPATQPAPEPMLIGSPQPAMTAPGMAAGRPAKMMNPVDAVVSCLKHTVTFDGRASRSEFWWFLLAFQIANIALTFVGVTLALMTEVTGFVYLGYLIYLLYPAYLSAGVRRMHDHGKSGWFILIPIYNIVLFATEGESMPNTYGPVPTNVLAPNLL